MNPQLIWIALAAVAAFIIVGLIAAGVRRSRTEGLREHFGSEYDRAVSDLDSRDAAERELKSRAKEVKALDVRPLTAEQRNSYREEWMLIEARFIERPATAVVAADELVGAIMHARGYPVADFEKYAAWLSVKYPKLVEHYRAGHTIIDEYSKGRASTEDLGKAMLNYRALFDVLVGGRVAGHDVAHAIVSENEIAAASPRERSRERVAREDDERLRPN